MSGLGASSFFGPLKIHNFHKGADRPAGRPFYLVQRPLEALQGQILARQDRRRARRLTSAEIANRTVQR